MVLMLDSLYVRVSVNFKTPKFLKFTNPELCSNFEPLAHSQKKLHFAVLKFEEHFHW